MQNNESRWTVIANGKQIANGTTIRKNGVVSHFVTTEKDKENKKKEEKVFHDDESIDLNEFSQDEFTAEDDERTETKCPVLKVNTSCIKAPNEALSTVIHQLKWRECKGNIKFGNHTADLYWHGAGFDEDLYNKPGVYAVNKLPGMVELSQKIHLSKIIKRMQTLFPGEFDFYPPTWFLPEQYHQFVTEVLLKNKGKPDLQPPTTPDSNRSRKKGVPTYIVKPDCGSQGEGIRLVTDPRDVQDAIGSKPAVVQTYIDNPLLLDNFKFDLRMYVAIARLHPLEIYLCKDGLARLCTVEYEPPRPSNVSNTFMHLTNYSLNKFSDDFKLTNAEHTGSKRTYRGMRRILQKRGIDVEKIHQQIVDLVVKTVLSLIPDVMIWDHVTNRSRCVRSFQILGFDIMLTSDLKAHLLEVNSSPSMGIDIDVETEPGSGVVENLVSVVDEQIKVPLLRDVLRLIAFGESEINMKKSCLERVYPAPSTTNQSLTRQCSKKSHTSTAQKSASDPHFRPTVERLPLGHLNRNDTSDCYVDTSRSMPNVVRKESKGVNHRDFDNPLLRANVTSRQHYPAKRPKKFTVIKYKQEYAISTEEWRLFQLRSKLSSRLGPIKSSSSMISRVTHPAVTPRMLYQTPTAPRTEPPKRVKVTEGDNLCKVCGHYLDGIGLGLFYTQQKYKAALEQNDHEFNDHLDKHSSSEDISFVSKSQISLSECESGVRFPHPLETLPPRSIYFDFAQTEGGQSARRPASKESCFPLFVDRDVEERRRDICDSCLESSTTSSSEDSNYIFKRTISTASPRTRSNHRVLPERKSKSEGFSTQDLLLVKRIASVFIFFNGFKPSLRMSATSFRNMARKCRLCESGAMPAIDILFIDIMRQWQRHSNDHSAPYYDTFRIKNPITSHQPSGLPFQGFLEAIFRIAKARFKGANLNEKLETLVSYCEQYMTEANRTVNKRSKRTKAIQHPKHNPMPSPRVSCGMSTRQPYY